MRSRPLSSRVAALCEEVLPRLGTGVARQHVLAVQEGLAEPLRVAVAGRVKAGKSTLVNALLGRRVAPTDVGECTLVVTEYRYGNPERVEVQPKAGSLQRIPLDPDGGLPTSLGLAPRDVDHVTAWLSNQALRHMTIIDTPGLASARSGASSPTEKLLAVDHSSRVAVRRADALVFVLTQEARQDELDVLSAFRSQMGDISTTVVNAVAVLNKVDKLAPSASEPVKEAAAVVDRYRSDLRASVAAVVPVVGLLAETAGSGALHEQDFHHLEELASLENGIRTRLLLSSDRFTSLSCDVPESARRRLLAHLDLFGVRCALNLIDGGTRGAGALTSELNLRSGIEAVRMLLEDVFASRSDALKAEWALDALERISSGSAQDGIDALTFRRILGAGLERVRLEPEMQHLKVIGALQRCSRGEVALPVDLLDELQRVASEPSIAARLGCSRPFDITTLKGAALGGVARWKAFENDSRNWGAGAEVAAVARRSYEAMWSIIDQDAGPTGPPKHRGGT